MSNGSDGLCLQLSEWFPATTHHSTPLLPTECVEVTGLTAKYWGLPELLPWPRLTAAAMVAGTAAVGRAPRSSRLPSTLQPTFYGTRFPIGTPLSRSTPRDGLLPHPEAAAGHTSNAIVLRRQDHCRVNRRRRHIKLTAPHLHRRRRGWLPTHITQSPLNIFQLDGLNHDPTPIFGAS